MKSKKAQGISMNIIIMAVVALVVMIILIFVFRDRITMMQKNVVQTCDEQGGECAKGHTCDNPKYPIKTIAKGCDEKGQSIVDEKEKLKKSGPCCLPLPKQE